MSRAAEERHEVWFKQHLIDCAANFTVGAKVWRPHYNEIQEGTVTKVARCKLVDGRPYEDKDGDRPYYVAKFGKYPTNEFAGDYEDQTYAWKFFWKEEHARYELIEQIHRQVEDKQRDIEKLKKLEQDLVAAGAEDNRKW